MPKTIEIEGAPRNTATTEAHHRWFDVGINRETNSDMPPDLEICWREGLEDIDKNEKGLEDGFCLFAEWNKLGFRNNENEVKKWMRQGFYRQEFTKKFLEKYPDGDIISKQFEEDYGLNPEDSLAGIIEDLVDHEWQRFEGWKQRHKV